jgi:hypothetical protein
MANNNKLIYGSPVASVVQNYYAPVSGTASNPTIPIKATYCFIAKVTPWANNASPDLPSQDQQSIKNTFANIISLKLVEVSDISPVIQRNDWTTNTIYDYYKDTTDMLAIIPATGKLKYTFYVRNKFDQVFKCLWNNNGAPSTSEPYFQPGSYNTNNIYQGPDGYKWKFMYTIDLGSKTKFMDSNWLPVPVPSISSNPLLTSAGLGSIDVVNVVNGGSGYTPTLVPTTISISPPNCNLTGTGFTGSVSVDGQGKITDIVVITPGSNYTFANATISSANGSGAVLVAPTSPIGGHGFDPISELGCYNIMYSVQFNGSEMVNSITMVPTDITYYQVGLIVNPTASETTPNPANSTIYKATTDVVVSYGFGAFVSGEQVYQGNQPGVSTGPSFTGTVVDFNLATNVLSLINIQGVLTTSAPITGLNSGCSRSVSSVSSPDFNLFTGYITYIDNRSGIQRSTDGIEQIKFVMSLQDLN